MGRTLRKDKEPEVKKTVRFKKAAEVVVLPAARARTSRQVAKKTTSTKAPKSKKAPIEVVTMPPVLTVAKPTRRRSVSSKAKVDSPAIPVQNQVVFVPSTASLRLLEKVELYRLWYKDNFPTYMAKTAQVSGYAFVLCGTFFASLSYLADKELFGPAATICTQVDCVEIADTDLPQSAPLITFLNSLPALLSTDTDIVLRVENSGEPVVSLKHLESGERTTLVPTEIMPNGEYKYLVKSDMRAGTYLVQAEARDGATTYKFTGPSLTVAGDIKVTTPKPIVPVLPTEVATTSASSTTFDANDADQSREVADEDFVTGPLPPLSTRVETLVDSTYLRINVGDFAPEAVEVYSRLTADSEVVFLGLATPVQGEWILSLSALDLPQYQHQLFASFVVHGKTYQTEAAVFSPTTDTGASLTTESELLLLVQKIELALATSDVKNDTRHQYFSHISSTTPTFFDTAHEVTFADESLLQEADAQMQLSRESIDRLLSYYAAAVQGGQKYLLNFVDTKLVSTYKQIANSSDVSQSTTALETLYALRFQALKDRVRDMEQQVGDETSNLAARDMDNDGFSDFDEIANYGTDPAKADTDKDGVLDSVEIISSFDPLVSDIHGITSLKQNIDERTFDDVVRIRGAEAITQKNNSGDKTFVVVSGTSIPNSYVTILSYTLGTVGVIRTNSAGEFSYTLEKDLTEGEYEVVALLADNNGEVVAASKVFQFTKTKHSLVAAAASQETTAISPGTSHDNLPTVVTASVAVAAFGFLLLLLSKSLENRRREIVRKATLKTQSV